MLEQKAIKDQDVEQWAWDYERVKKPLEALMGQIVEIVEVGDNPDSQENWFPYYSELGFSRYSRDDFDISATNMVYSFNGSIIVTDYQGTYENAIYSGRAYDPRFSHQPRPGS